MQSTLTVERLASQADATSAAGTSQRAHTVRHNEVQLAYGEVAGPGAVNERLEARLEHVPKVRILLLECELRQADPVMSQ
jgi:TPP-dependent trihydroxycyclohexane-1,2-dione (THcHDO) dehydratase